MFRHMAQFTNDRLMYLQIASPVIGEQEIVYPFGRCLYSKQFTLHLNSFISLCFLKNETHDPGVASAMLYQLSYKKLTQKPQNRKQFVASSCLPLKGVHTNRTTNKRQNKTRQRRQGVLNNVLEQKRKSSFSDVSLGRGLRC